MKKLGLLLMIVVLGSTISMAQNRSGQGNYDPVESAKKQTEVLKKELDLNKDQEKKVHELNLKAANKMADLRKEMQNSGSREEMREKFGEMREEQNKEMKKILTDDQYKKYEKYLEERRARRGQGGGGGGGNR